MCAIFGSFHKTMFEILYEANKQRGNFASSVVCVADNDEYITKQEGNIDFDKFNYAGKSNIEYILGHVQAPTSAKREWNYNTSHPFESMSWLVSHNGVLTNDKKLRRKHTRFLENPVDTAVIVELLEKFAQVNKNPVNTIKQVLTMLEGSYALSMMHCYTNEIYIARVGSLLHYDNKGNYSTMPGSGYKILPEGVIMKLNKKTKRWNKVGIFESKSPFYICMSTFIFSVTAGKKGESLLNKTGCGQTPFFIKEDNKESLHKMYNKAIDFAIQENFEELVLVHDDVILENFSEERLERLFKKFDVVGCAGTTEVKLQPPALWHIMGGGFGSGNLFGAVAHGTEDDKHMTVFGAYPKRVVLLDGVLLAIKRKVFKKIRFDENCPSKWHFYDLDYSMQCHKAGFKLGVGDILVTHNSPGLTSVTEEFKKGEAWFLDKWKTE